MRVTPRGARENLIEDVETLIGLLSRDGEWRVDADAREIPHHQEPVLQRIEEDLFGGGRGSSWLVSRSVTRSIPSIRPTPRTSPTNG